MIRKLYEDEIVLIQNFYVQSDEAMGRGEVNPVI